ncbi:MAG: penicillin-binding protein 2 [Candidatus Omnitrophota bacterium]
MRLKVIRLAISLLFLIVAGGLVYTQLIRGPYYFNLSKNNRIRVVAFEARRGKILDRNGVMLAGSRVSFDVMIIPQEIQDKSVLFAYLGEQLSAESVKLLERYEKKKLAPFTPVTVAEDIPKSVALVLEENKFRFPGLWIYATNRRYYPFNEVGAHVLGYVGQVSRSRLNKLKDYGYTLQGMTGYTGIEEYYDSYLRGGDGGSQIEVNSRGQQVRILGIKEPVSGQDIILSIDSRIQKMAAETLQEYKGAIVMMDWDTGEILAMVSSPSFDLNAFMAEGRDKEVTQIMHNADSPLMNRAIAGLFPPGSTFKIPIAVGALEKRLIQPGTTFNCPGYYKLGRRRFRCSHAHGIQNLTEGIAHSCNVYFYNTGLLLGPELISRYAELFGLGMITNIDLPGEVKGSIPNPEKKRVLRKEGWYQGDTLNLSIGQGDVMVTPLQLTKMMAIVARNGRDIQPHVFRATQGSAMGDDRFKAEARLDIKQETFAAVKAGLRGAVGDYAGTAHLLDIEGLKISGKTGTAQTSGGRPTHAWFTGFCTDCQPKIAFCVFLEFGGSSYIATREARKLLIRLKEANIFQ